MVSPRNHFTYSLGIPALRRTISDWLARRYGLADIDPETQVIPVNGSLLAVWMVGPLGAQKVALNVSPALIGGVDDANAGTRGATALALAGMSPTESVRLVTLGRALGLVGEWRLAQQAFQQAVGEDGQDALAWAWLGEARQQLGQDAASELDKAVALDPQSVVIRGLRGLYWKRLGNERNALQEYQAAASSDPQNPAWPASLGETYARLGDLVSALQSYERATQLAPRDSLYWRLLATFCLEYNLQVETIGLPAAERAQQLAPDDPLAVDVLGWSQLAAGRPWEAVQTLPRALELAPDFALAHYHLALAYLQTGERTAAYNQLKLAIDLDPGGSVGHFHRGGWFQPAQAYADGTNHEGHFPDIMRRADCWLEMGGGRGSDNDPGNARVFRFGIFDNRQISAGVGL